MTDYIENMDNRGMKLMRLAQSMIRTTGNDALTEAYKAARLSALGGNEPKTFLQMVKMRDEMVKAYEDALRNGFAPIDDEMVLLSMSEADFAAAALVGANASLVVKAPANAMVEKYIKNSLITLKSKNLNESFTWNEYTDKYFTDSNSRVKATITNVWRESNLTGELPSLHNYIKAVKTVTDGVNKQSIETVIRTGVTSFSVNGRMSFYDDNKDVIERLYLNVTFDNRISKICLSMGARYGIGSKGFTIDKPPQEGLPPYHPNCRTNIIAKAVGQEFDGNKGAVVGNKEKGSSDAFKAREDRLRTKSKVTSRGNKDDLLIAKEIAASTPISKFLRNQPAYYIDDVLGKTKGAAFRSGRLDLSQLTDKQLKPLTIEQLNL
jgi:hypothetical protein